MTAQSRCIRPRHKDEINGPLLKASHSTRMQNRLKQMLTSLATIRIKSDFCQCAELKCQQVKCKLNFRRQIEIKFSMNQTEMGSCNKSNWILNKFNISRARCDDARMIKPGIQSIKYAIKYPEERPVAH